MKTKLSIVIPAYNEEKRIGKTLEEYSKFFNSLVKEKKLKDYQLLVVINGTTDNTEGVVKKYHKKNRRIIYIDLKEGGKGLAINKGFIASLKKDFNIIGFVDADLATPPEQYWRLIKNLGSCDGAIADRYLPKSKIYPPHSLRRTLVSRVYNLIVRSLFNFHYRDTQCGAKVLKRKALEKISKELALTNWAFDVNILHLLKKHGLKIKSIPTVWYEVTGGSLNISRASIQLLFALIQLRILHSPFRKFLKVISPIIGIIYKVIRRN
jgi:glycosyltransferase involved in cell wall biosynthesis